MQSKVMPAEQASNPGQQPPAENGAHHLQLFIQKEYMTEVRSGVNAILDTFQDVLKMTIDNSGNDVPKQTDSYLECLRQIETECWSRIRNDFLSKANDPSEVDPPACMEEMVLKLVDKLDKIKDGLEIKIQQIAYKDDNTQQEIRDLKQQLGEERHKLVDIKWQHQKQSEESSGAPSIVVLKQQLEEKRELIAELQRSSTVQLWEKEKVKVLEKATQREEKLKLEYAELKQTYDELRDRTTKRIRDLEEKVKIGKMKGGVGPKTPRTDWEAENDQLKRQMYIKDVEARKIEQEMIKQQKLYAGCLKGIKRDFKIITEREEKEKIATEDIRKLTNILEAIFRGTCVGRLEQTKSDLPLHYFAVDEDITGHPLKKTKLKLVAAPALKLENIDECRVNPDNYVGADPPKTAKSRVWSDKKSDVEGSSTASSSWNPPWLNKDAVGVRQPSPLPPKDSNGAVQNGTNTEEKDKADHPALIDEDGLLDSPIAMKCFPHMTEHEIKEHFEQFDEYDANDDHTLDFVEMLQAIRGTVGDYFKPRQIKEAMAEIDVDRSEAVDFYEYLRISALLLKKAGKSEIFRSELVQDTSGSMSRVCSIQ